MRTVCRPFILCRAKHVCVMRACHYNLCAAYRCNLLHMRLRARVRVRVSAPCMFVDSHLHACVFGLTGPRARVRARARQCVCEYTRVSPISNSGVFVLVGMRQPLRCGRPVFYSRYGAVQSACCLKGIIHVGLILSTCHRRWSSTVDYSVYSPDWHSNVQL